VIQAEVIENKRLTNKWIIQADVSKLLYTLFCAIVFLEIFESILLPEKMCVSNYGLFFILMFGLFGFIAFVFKQRYYVFTSLMTCAAIASFIQHESRNSLFFATQNEKLEISMLYVERIDEDNEEDVLKCLLQYNPLVFGIASVTLNQNSMFNEFIKGSEYCIIQHHGKKAVIYSKIRIKEAELDLHFLSDYILENVGQKELLIGEYRSGETSFNQNQKNLNSLGEKINSEHNSKIIFGDFGTVFWDKRIRNFRARTKLQNARHDISNPDMTLHMFYSEDLICTSFRDLNIGKDDKAIIAKFQFISDSHKESEISMLLFSEN
jgi:hypothetical protein